MYKRIVTAAFLVFSLGDLYSGSIHAADNPQDVIQADILSKNGSIEISQGAVTTGNSNTETPKIVTQEIILTNRNTPEPARTVVSRERRLAQPPAKKIDDFAEAKKTKGWKIRSAARFKKNIGVDSVIQPLQSSEELQALGIKRKQQRETAERNLEKRQARKAVLSPAAGSEKRGASLGFTVMESSETAPRILSVPAYLVFQAMQGQTRLQSQTFKISNTGAGTLKYNLAKTADWLAISSSSGAIISGEDSITVTITPAGLNMAGSPYIDDVIITNTDVPADSRKLRVRLSLFDQEVYSRIYTYDSNNNLTRRITPDNKIIEYKYDKLSRLSGIYYPDGNEVTYQYDANGNPIKMTDWQGDTEYVYDDLNRMIRVNFPGGASVGYDYDESGKIIKIIYPTKEEVIYGYNDDNQLIKVTDQANTTVYEYASDKKTGNLVKKILPNGVWTEYVYDAAKRITDVRNKMSDGSNISSYHYDYDANNNRIFVEETASGRTKTVSYVYDKLNRLTRADYSDGTFEAYTYDASGNRLTKTTQTETINYEYDSDNRLIKDTNTAYFYDKSGNLIKKIASGKTFAYGYDYNNKLIRYNDGSNSVEFRYDGNGSRVIKRVNDKIARYINDINRSIVQVLLETDEKWNVKKKYVYGLDLISQEEK